MAKQTLSEVDITLPSGLKTTVRVGPEQAAKLGGAPKRRGRPPKATPEPPDKARQPTTRTGDVETK